MPELLESAAGGSVEAEVELALAYDEGKATPRDVHQAAEWYARAAAQGSGASEMQLGYFCEIGDGVPQDYAAARVHYEHAIALGAPTAGLRLGILHLEGWGGPRDLDAAVRVITEAAEAGDRPSQAVLSDMYFTGVGVKADLEKALAWRQPAAEADDPEAETGIGRILERMHRQDHDQALARDWYQLSAEQDYAGGMLAMAKLILQAGHSPEEVEIARQWFELAAEGKNGAALFYLASFYLCIPKYASEPGAPEKAWKLLEEARDNGEARAAEVLELSSTGRSLSEALNYELTVPFDKRYVTRSIERAKWGNNALGNSEPIALKIVRPVYPTGLRLAQTEGRVVVDFIVDTTGRVQEAKAVKYSHPGFAAAAVLSIEGWRFLPGTADGRAVSVHMQVPVDFQISEASHEQHISVAGRAIEVGSNDRGLEAEKELPKEGSDAVAYNDRGYAKRVAGDLDGAIADLTRAIELKPDYWNAMNNRGVAEAMKHDLPAALADFNHAIALAPQQYAGYGNRGLAELQVGELDEAIFDFSQSISFRPGGVPMYALRGRAELCNGEIAAAEEDFSHAISLSPNYPSTYNNRAVAEEISGDIPGALADYLKFIALAPRAADSVRLHVWFLRRLHPDLPGPQFSEAPVSGSVLQAIAFFLDGSIGEADLLKRLPQGDAVTVGANQCAFYYYIGMKRLSNGLRHDGRAALEKSVSAGGPFLDEYVLARTELRRLNGTDVRTP